MSLILEIIWNAFALIGMFSAALTGVILAVVLALGSGE